MAVAWSSSSVVAQSQGQGVISVIFFPIDNALYGSYRAMNFATKDRFGLIYLFTVKSDKIQFPIIKGHNCD